MRIQRVRNLIKVAVLFTLAAIPSHHVFSEIYLPIWGALKPHAGTASQSDDDLYMNSSGLDSSDVSCTRVSSDGGLVYSIVFERDLDGDGGNDTLSFDLKVEAFVDSTYEYSSNPGESSMTALGASTDATDIGNVWGVNGDFDLDEGESLRFSVDNIVCSVEGVTFVGLNSVSLMEPDGGHTHQYILGEGTGLDSGAFNQATSSAPIAAAYSHSFVITGADSGVPTREWAVSSITFQFKGPLGDWDPTDYSHYKIGPSMLEEYPEQTDFTNYPEFSWDTVPRWLAARKHIPWDDSEIEALAKYPLIVWEKAGQAGFSTVEEGIIDSSKRVKAINPSVKSIFYRNSKMHYGGYASDESFDPWEFCQKEIDENGEEVLVLQSTRYMYDHNIPEMRDWWINESALPTTLDDAIDGIFYDKCGHEGYLYDENGDPVDSYTQMLDTMDKELPSGKLVIGNTLRNERANGSRDLMRILEGSYLERWNLPQSGYGQLERVDGTCVSMQLMMEATSKGKIILFKTGENSAASTREEMEEDMPYHLALYLMVAGQYSYFSYQDSVAGHTEDYHWETNWMEEFNRPLGEPLGEAIKDGYIYSRSFQHLDVGVDVETMETFFAWDSVDSDEDGMDDLWEFRNFGDVVAAAATDDADGDGATNLEEHDGETDPNDSSDIPSGSGGGEDADLLFEDVFDGDSLLINQGTGGSLLNLTIQGASWVDDGEATFDPAGNTVYRTRAIMYSENTYQSDTGFKLTISYTTGTIARSAAHSLSFGLIDSSTILSSYSGYNPFGVETELYGIGANITTYNGAPLQGLVFTDGVEVHALDQSGTNVAYKAGEACLVTIEIGAGGSWSYSIDGVVEASGVLPEGFDLTKEYRIVVYGQDDHGGGKAIHSILLERRNNAPIADAQSLSTLEDAQLDVILTGADADGDALSFSIVESPTNGSLSGVAPDLVYTPDLDFVGSDSFTFVVNDGTEDSAAETVEIEVLADTDGDGVINDLDTDDDNDGTPDESDALPLDPSEQFDADGDGIGDNADTDDDNDGVPDLADAFPFDPAEQLDTDGDGVGNNADTDDDNDGTPDESDDLPLDPTEQSDLDGDGIGDNADNDDDGDGVLDLDDSCPTTPNADQADVNADGYGDVCVDTGSEVSPSAVLGYDPFVGAGTVIGNRVLIKDHPLIGENVRIGHDATICDDFTIGDGSAVGEFSWLGNDVFIGSETEVDRFVILGDGAVLGDIVELERFSEYGTNARIGDRSSLGYFTRAGHALSVGEDTRLDRFSSYGDSVSVGDRVETGFFTNIGSSVSIGDDVSIGFFVRIGDGSTVGAGAQIGKFVRIGKNVTISDGAVVRLGARIPDNAIVE